MTDTLVMPRVTLRTRGAHRKARATATVVAYGAFTVATAAIAAFGLWAMLTPRSACRTEPMHAGWPNSHCHLTWAKWKAPGEAHWTHDR